MRSRLLALSGNPWSTVSAVPGLLLNSHLFWGVVQEDDVIGILTSDNIADLKPLGDRILLEARPLYRVQAMQACHCNKFRHNHPRMMCMNWRRTSPTLLIKHWHV